MRRSPILVVLLGAAATFGCASPQYRWVHPEKTLQQLSEDRLQCDTEFESNESTPVFDRQPTMTTSECLYEKGWRQEPVE